MAKLIIGNDFINFMHGSKIFAGHITRLILDDTVIFNINYNCVETSEYGKCELVYMQSPGSNELKWVTSEKGLPHEFVRAIGREIEKNKDLFTMAVDHSN